MLKKFKSTMIEANTLISGRKSKHSIGNKISNSMSWKDLTQSCCLVSYYSTHTKQSAMALEKI